VAAAQRGRGWKIMMAPFLTQERFPKLWLLFQAIFGATREKKRLALKHLGDHRNVIEIGCSAGVLARAFADVPGLRYLGVDIDPRAIELATERFSDQKNVSFSTQTMRELGDQGHTFDYVLFANILHHVDDPTAVDLIRDASRLVAPGGTMVVIEPDILRPDDSLLVRSLYKLERGLFRRPPAEYERLMHEAGVRPAEFSSEDVSIDTLPGLTCGHLLVYKFGPGVAPHGR
jgi:SAM-dependent methyltransferase